MRNGAQQNGERSCCDTFNGCREGAGSSIGPQGRLSLGGRPVEEAADGTVTDHPGDALEDLDHTTCPAHLQQNEI